MLDDQSINHLFNKSLLTAQYNPSTLPVLCLKPFPGKQTNEHQQQKTLGKKGESMFYWGWKGKKKENVPLWQFQYCNMDHLPLQDAQTLLDPYGVLKDQGAQHCPQTCHCGQKNGKGRIRESQGIRQIGKVCYGFTNQQKAIRAVSKIKHKLLTAQISLHSFLLKSSSSSHWRSHWSERECKGCSFRLPQLPPRKGFLTQASRC